MNKPKKSNIVVSDEEDSSSQVKQHSSKNKKQLLMSQLKQEALSVLRNKKATKDEKLACLMKQAEIYTHFLISHQKTSESEQNRRNKSRHREKGDTQEDEDDDLANTTRLYYQPSNLKGTLKSYQLDGLNWVISLYENGLNGILADEMGLGKTIQTISFIAFLRQYKGKNGHHIIIVPKSTMPNWQREIAMWCPEIKLVVLNPIKEERENSLKIISQKNFDVVITSYEGVNICLSTLKKLTWETVIIDEAHRIKNENALLSKNVRDLKSGFRLLVTGTPLQNNLHELWALLNFLLPELFSSSEDFDSWFGEKKENKDNPEEVPVVLSMEEREQNSVDLVHKLHKILRPFLLRRTKNEVEKSLPPKKEIHIKVGLTEIQKEVYKKLLKKSMDSETKIGYKNTIMQLRKVCNHPYLFDGVEDYSLPDLGEHLIKNSSKMRVLDKLMTKVVDQKNQILIFSQMTRVLDILEDYLVYRNITYCRIDGNTSLEDRELQIAEFTKPGSPIVTFLLSTRAGGLGINLMSANTVVLYDSDWNPQVDLQAMDRVHRIGQTKTCMIYRLICENTIEEKIIERQAMRLVLDSLVIQQGRLAKHSENFSKEQMKEMIQYGADAILKTGDDCKDEDIDKILENAEKVTDEFYEKAKEEAKSKVSLLLDLNFTNSCDIYRFEDENYLKKRQEEQDALIASREFDEYKLQNTKRDRNLKLPNLNFDQNIDMLLNFNKPAKKKYKSAKVPFFHLYRNRERLAELKQKQINAIVDSGKKLPEGFDEDLFAGEELSKKEHEEMVELAKTGFTSWDRKEYDIFISIVEKLGHSVRLEHLKQEISTKDETQIEEYLKAFWERASEVPDGARILKNIEKRDKLEKMREHSQNMLNAKVNQSNATTWEEVKLVFPSNANRHAEFNLEEDQFLVFMGCKHGYGNWDKIIREIRLSDDFMFNYYLKSRDKSEIQKRIDYLVKIIEREFSEIREKENKENRDIKERNRMEIDDESRIRNTSRVNQKISQSNQKINSSEVKNDNNINKSAVKTSVYKNNNISNSSVKKAKKSTSSVVSKQKSIVLEQDSDIEEDNDQSEEELNNTKTLDDNEEAIDNNMNKMEID